MIDENSNLLLFYVKKFTFAKKQLTVFCADAMGRAADIDSVLEYQGMEGHRPQVALSVHRRRCYTREMTFYVSLVIS